ncbi:MAG TPA: MFS transporter [Acidimicrobiales bacterium]|nr:MFS transporter [Acidimicrobiales bacterium]
MRDTTVSPRYKWIALSNTTLGILMATINGSILLIALPDIFKGIKLDPLAPHNTSYFLWVLMSFLLVTSVLVVSLGRVGDMFGRVRMYTLGFAVFTVFSILLAVTWMTGPGAALWIILMRVGQGVGGAFLFANSNAIITDAFPPDERGLALGINGVAAIGGAFIGLLLGGLLAPIEWRLVFLVSVPVGLFGTIWAWARLRETGVRNSATHIDWLGNASFALGLIGILTGIVYGLQPYGGHTMGWTSPFVLSCLIGGVAVLVAFAVIETRVNEPMFQLHLFSSRGFSTGNVAALLLALARGGLQFMLIIWLQGIWLPLHGYSFVRTPLWAGIYMVPLTIGFFVAGPVAGRLADRHGARMFATLGLVLTAVSFVGLQAIPINFPYPLFAGLIFLVGLSMGLFAAPNTSAVMNSLPVDQRGAGGAMLNTFQNSASVLSIGFFFTVITLGLAATLPKALLTGLTRQGVPHAVAVSVSHIPPIGSLFSAFLGINPIKTLLGAKVLAEPGVHSSVLLGRGFFPGLISAPFANGLHLAFLAAAAMCLLGAVVSWLRGPNPAHDIHSRSRELQEGLGSVAEVAMSQSGAGSPGAVMEPDVAS